MSKVRVHELAKELGVSSKDVLAKLQELGEFVKSASSTVEAPVIRKLKEAMPAVEAPAKKTAAKKTTKKAAAAVEAPAAVVEAEPAVPAEPAMKAASAPTPVPSPAPVADPVEALLIAARARPEAPEGWRALGDALHRAGRLGEAGAAYEQAMLVGVHDPALRQAALALGAKD